MKKWIAIPLVVALLSFGSTTMAKGDHGSSIGCKDVSINNQATSLSLSTQK